MYKKIPFNYLAESPKVFLEKHFWGRAFQGSGFRLHSFAQLRFASELHPLGATLTIPFGIFSCERILQNVRNIHFQL